MGRYLLTLAHLQHVEGRESDAQESASAALAMFQGTLGEQSTATGAARKAMHGDYSLVMGDMNLETAVGRESSPLIL